MPRVPRRAVTMPTGTDGTCPACGATGNLKRCAFGMPPGPDPDPGVRQMGCTITTWPPSAFVCDSCGAQFNDAGIAVPDTLAPRHKLPVPTRIPRTRVKDSRYSTRFADEDELLGVLDLDSLDEVETFLMFLWHRPLTLTVGIDPLGEQRLDLDFPEADKTGTGTGTEVSIALPTSVAGIMNDGTVAGILQGLGPYSVEPALDWDPQAVHKLSGDRQVAVMRECLGLTRMFTMLDEHE